MTSSNYEFLEVQSEPVQVIVNLNLVSRVEISELDGEPHYSGFNADGSWFPMDEAGYKAFKELVNR